MLGVDDTTLEALAALELGQMAPLVIVIAGAGEQEVRGEALGRTFVLSFDAPNLALGIPRRARNLVLEADMAIDPVLTRGFVHVLPDGGPVGDSLVPGPRFEIVAEREHVAVGADAGIAEQIPRAANNGAVLQDDVALVGAMLAQVHAGADARQARADDENVEMFALR